jgi:hypothetical protein
MTIIKKVKLKIIRKATEWLVIDIRTIPKEEMLKEVDRLVVLSELRKINNFERMLNEFVNENRNQYFDLNESNQELRLLAKGATMWAVAILKAMQDAPLKLKKIAEDAERQFKADKNI